jgi:hypothetical protein
MTNSTKSRTEFLTLSRSLNSINTNKKDLMNLVENEL